MPTCNRDYHTLIDYRDATIEHFARSEYDLAVQSAALRESLRIVLAMLHDANNRERRLRDTHERLVEEYRQFRCRAMRESR